jgi:hypothetical protein
MAHRTTGNGRPQAPRLRRRIGQMDNRTHRLSVVFRRPFRLRGWAEAQPAGTYAVETEEELIEGLSFPAWRRVATSLTRQHRPGTTVEAIPVDPADLAMAQAADAADAPVA